MLEARGLEQSQAPEDLYGHVGGLEQTFLGYKFDRREVGPRRDVGTLLPGICVYLFEEAVARRPCRPRFSVGFADLQGHLFEGADGFFPKASRSFAYSSARSRQ